MTERKCDDCGLPISICNARASVEYATSKHGSEAVAKAINPILASEKYEGKSDGHHSTDRSGSRD